MQEKPINQVVKEFAAEFGTVDFKAVDQVQDLTVVSKNWVEHSYKFEISGEDYVRLGATKAGCEPPTEGVVGLMLGLVRARR